MSLADLLKKLDAEDPEIIDGANVSDTARDCVDLGVEFTPVIPVRCAEYPPHFVPDVVRVVKDGERYCLMSGTDYQWIGVGSLKVMRARYLLLRGWYYRHLRTLSHPEREEVLAKFFKGGTWLPAEGSALAKAMDVR